MKPLIGITACLLREMPNRDWIWNTNDYFRAVQRAGGIPVLLPFVESEAAAAEVLDRVDGLLLSGGDDLDPLLYGEMPHPRNGSVSPERDITELAYVRIALQRNMATFGICRGHQVLAVASGGTLWQDIPSQVPTAIQHRQEAPRWFAAHPVSAAPGTKLAAILGAEFRVNSYHHQAVQKLPPGWVPSAVAPDGINEAMEHPGYHFALSVQWHPENFQGRPYNFDALFRAFVEASEPRNK